MKWFVSEILDDGRKGIVDEEGRIIVGIPNRLSEEQLSLVAAAPEMLEALRSARNRLFVHQSESAKAIVGKCDEAIAMAEVWKEALRAETPVQRETRETP